MSPRLTRALAVDSARPVVVRGWNLGWSADRIAAHADITAPAVLRLAREMQLPKRERRGRK